MNNKAYVFDDNGYMIGEGICQIDPLETKAAGREIFIMPANSTEIEPPPEKDGFKIKWNGSEWIYEELPTEKEEKREKTKEEKEQAARNERNLRLTFTDWTQLPDAPLTAEQKAAYATYRQALRDVPAQSGFPDAIEWPEEP